MTREGTAVSGFSQWWKASKGATAAALPVGCGETKPREGRRARSGGRGDGSQMGVWLVVVHGLREGCPMEKGDEGVAASHHDEEAAGPAGGAKRQETLLGLMLRRGLSIAGRGGNCTPTLAWKLEEDVEEAEASRSDSPNNHNRARSKQHHRHRAAAGAVAAVSARNLSANLEIQDTLHHPMTSRSGVTSRHHKDEKLAGLSDLLPLGHHEQLQSAASLRRHVAESFIQHHKSTDRNAHALQPVSPVCYSSSMETTSSLDLKGRPGYNFKTSTKLLKVLNHVWSLEEQLESSISVVKMLKCELEHAQARIREMLRERQSDRHEIDDLVKQITEGKLVRKSKEQGTINSAIQSIRHELEEERRLRRCSESLHQILANELSGAKIAFSKTLNELEREKNAHKLLQYLCDEFAKGVGEYEQEVRELKQRSEKGCDLRSDHFVLHISETWLDERLQMKLAEAQGDPSEKRAIKDRLMCEIETFLESRRSNSLTDDVLVHKGAMKDSCSHRRSLESDHLNGAVSAPQDVEDEDSLDVDFHCFKLNMGSFKPNNIQSVEKLEQTRKSNATWKTIKSFERVKCQNSPNSRTNFEAHAQSCNKAKMQCFNRVHGIHTRNISGGGKDANQLDVVLFQMLENGEDRKDVQGIKFKQDCAPRSNHAIMNTISESELGQVFEAQAEDEHMEDSCEAISWRQQLLMDGGNDASGNCCALSSPTQQWTYNSESTDLGFSECSPKLTQGVKVNTMKAQLFEARLEMQQAHRPR